MCGLICGTGRVAIEEVGVCPVAPPPLAVVVVVVVVVSRNGWRR